MAGDDTPPGRILDVLDDILASLVATPWTAYTPVYAATGSALGNGAITGKYSRVGNTIHYRIRFIPGNTTTPGTGAFTFTLPVAAVADVVDSSGAKLVAAGFYEAA